MPLARENSTPFTPAPAGTHIGRCIGMVSLGTQQPNSPQFKAAFKIMLIWELPNERLENDPANKAMTISKEYTCSLSEKATLRKDLEAWRGRQFTKDELGGFDVANVVDKPCMISIVHKTSGTGKQYAAVNAVTSLPKGTQVPPRVNDLVRFEIEDGQSETYKLLPEFIRNKIAASDEWMQPHAPVQEEPDHTPSDADEPLPF